MYLALILPQKASLLTLWTLLSLWCLLSLKAWSPSFFLAILVKLDGEMLNGFLLEEEPTSSAFLALSTSRWALTWSTISSLQTGSTPSLPEGLRFRRSWTEPKALHLASSLFRDLLDVGGGALTWPQVWAGHLELRMRQKKGKKVLHYLWAYSASIWATFNPWIFFSTKNCRWDTDHSLRGIAPTSVIHKL